MVSIFFFYYDPFSEKFIVTISYWVSIKMEAVPVKSRYENTTYVTYKQTQFLLKTRSNIKTGEINIRSVTGELMLFETGKSIVTLIFRTKSLFHWCMDYKHLNEQHVKEVMSLAVSSKSWQERLLMMWRRVFEFEETGLREWSSSAGWR